MKKLLLTTLLGASVAVSGAVFAKNAAHGVIVTDHHVSRITHKQAGRLGTHLTVNNQSGHVLTVTAADVEDTLEDGKTHDYNYPDHYGAQRLVIIDDEGNMIFNDRVNDEKMLTITSVDFYFYIKYIVSIDDAN